MCESRETIMKFFITQKKNGFKKWIEPVKTKKLLGIVTTANQIRIKVNEDGVNQFRVLTLRNSHPVSHRDLIRRHASFFFYYIFH